MYNFLKKIIKFMKYRFYINETIIIYSLKNHQKQTSSALIKFVSNNDIKDVLYFQSNRYINIFKNFLLLGDKGYFAYLQDKCIHRSWVKGNQQVVQFHWAYSYQLKENEIFIHYCETAPEARGKNIYPHVLSNIIEEHKNNDILISVNDKNISSKKGIEKVGFVKKQKIRILIILGLRFVKTISIQNNRLYKNKNFF